jgi:hypothetical protein
MLLMEPIFGSAFHSSFLLVGAYIIRRVCIGAF